MAADDFEGRLQLDPSVWSNPIKPNLPTDNFNLYGNPDLFIQRNFTNPFSNFPPQSPNTDKHQHLIGNFPAKPMVKVTIFRFKYLYNI